MSKQTKAIQFSDTFRHIDGLHYSALAIRICLEITSGPFTRRNWNLWTVAHHQLKVHVCNMDARFKLGDNNSPFHISIYDQGERWFCIPKEIFLTIHNAMASPQTRPIPLGWCNCTCMCAFGACTFIMARALLFIFLFSWRRVRLVCFLKYCIYFALFSYQVSL